MGGALKAIGGFVGKILKNPITQIALGVLTGGASSLFTGALSALGGGGLGSIFGGLANSFLGQASSMLSGSGLGALGSFLGQSGDSNGILGTVGNLLNSWTNNNTQDSQTTQAALQNVQEASARTQATQQLNNFWQNNVPSPSQVMDV